MWNTGKWSDISLFSIPFRNKSCDTLFVKILSISDALALLMRVGRLMSGINDKDSNTSTNDCVSGCESYYKISILKSPAI